MGWNLNAIILDKPGQYTLENIKERLCKFYKNDKDSKITIDDGAPPMMPPHIRIEHTVDEMGNPGLWIFTMHLEQGDHILQANEAAANDAPDSLDSKRVESSNTRIRGCFGDDPNRAFTTAAVDLQVFLTQLPDVAVHDPQQGQFL